MKLIIILLILFNSGVVVGQDTFKPKKIRGSILALTKRLPTYNDTLMTEYHQNTYDTIFKNATDNELYELTNHPNPLVRRSSFYSLLDRYSPKVIKLLQKNSGDTSQYFQIQYGSFIEKQTFVDELLFYLSSQSGWDRHFKMTKQNKNIVAMMLVRRKTEREEFSLTH